MGWNCSKPTIFTHIIARCVSQFEEPKENEHQNGESTRATLQIPHENVFDISRSCMPWKGANTYVTRQRRNATYPSGLRFGTNGPKHGTLPFQNDKFWRSQRKPPKFSQNINLITIMLWIGIQLLYHSFHNQINRI